MRRAPALFPRNAGNTVQTLTVVSRVVIHSITAGELAARLSSPIFGDATTMILAVGALESAGSGDLTFLSDPKFAAIAKTTRASTILVRDESLVVGAPVRIIHPAPHLAFAEALDWLFPTPAVVAGISPLARVRDLALLAGVEVREFASVGAGTRIGEGSLVHAHAVIGDDVTIGRDCIVHAGATIANGVRVGNRCIIHSGAVVGADGFGFQPSRQGWRKVAQVGTVVLGDDVEIGANTTIDRGAIDDTVIGNGVKIDNLVQVGHNCRIGDNTIIAACSGIAGSAQIGARCMLGGQAMINGHITICDDVVVSGNTVVASNVDQPGRITGVFPATDHRTWTKIAAGLRRGATRKPAAS